MKGFTLGLALKQRPKATRKSPIISNSADHLVRKQKLKKKISTTLDMNAVFILMCCDAFLTQTITI